MKTQEDLVVLDEDQKAVALKGIKDLFFASKKIHELLSSDTLTEEMKKNLLFLSESYLTSVATATNYESNLVTEVNKRFEEVRKANQRIQELEGQIANMKPIDGLNEQLRGLTEKIDRWWSELGFNFISDMSFSRYGGLNIKFSFSFERFSNLFSKTPVSDKKKDKDKVQQLRDKGFTFIESDNELKLADTDINKKLLIDLITERFSSITIKGMETWCDKNESHIRYVTAYIRDLSDI